MNETVSRTFTLDSMDMVRGEDIFELVRDHELFGWAVEINAPRPPFSLYYSVTFTKEA